MFSKSATATLRKSSICVQHRAARRTCVRVCAEVITIPETRRLLTSKGWNRSWIDGITERVSRNMLTVSLQELTQTVRCGCMLYARASCGCSDFTQCAICKCGGHVEPSICSVDQYSTHLARLCWVHVACGCKLEFLEAEGIPSEKAEHMAAMTWQILARTPEQMAKVMEYLRSRGVKDVATVVFQNPKLLEYDVSPDGTELMKGEKSRIKVDTIDSDGAQKVLVSFYRVGTAFKVSPISPWKPADS